MDPQKMNRKQFIAFAEEVIQKGVNNKRGVALRFPYDLRASLEMKSFDASSKTRWTAFVNNAGTLAHVVCPDADILIRIHFGYPIKHLSAWQMRTAIIARIEHWVLIN